MSKIRSYQDLVAWQKAFALAKAVFETTKTFPEDEEFTFVEQMRRAAIRVASKIADGWGRRSRQDYARAVTEARGYMYDVQTQMLVARDMGYVSDDDPVFEAVEEAERLINGLIRALERKEGERRPERRPRRSEGEGAPEASSEEATEQTPADDGESAAEADTSEPSVDEPKDEI